jgi:carnitine monooxygenase subunit
MRNISNEPVRSLPAHYYVDPAMFDLERDAVFARTWQFAGHASIVEQPGNYFSLRIAGENLFCIRGADGRLRTFYNVCRHRGHELVQGQGNCRFVVCPYHAWTYDLDGRLRSALNTENVEGFDRSTIRLSEVRTEEMCGFIFVNLDSTAKPMTEWFPDLEQEIREYVPQVDRLRPLEWVEVPETCNWKVSVENYAECYHCAVNHPTFAAGVAKTQTYDIQPQGYCLRHTTESQAPGKMSYPIDLETNEHAGDVSTWYLWPCFSFQVYPGNTLNTYHWRPVDVDHVIVWRGWFTIDGAESEVIRRLAVQDRQTTVEEDVRLVDSVQRGMNSRGYSPGPLVVDSSGRGVNSEHALHTLQGWIRDAVGE